jgi:hypothetical protein
MKRLFLLLIILANLLTVRAQEAFLFDFDNTLPGDNWPWTAWNGASIEVVDDPDLPGNKVAKITCQTSGGKEPQPAFYMRMATIQSRSNFAGFTMKVKSDFHQLRFTYTWEQPGVGQKGNWSTFPLYTANGAWQTMDFPFVNADPIDFNRIVLNATCWDPYSLPLTFTYYIDDVTLVNDYKIAPDETKTGAIYKNGAYKNIIFTAEETGNVGKLQLSAPLTVNGVVQLKKTFQESECYPIGFPFDIDSVYAAGYEDGRALQYFKSEEANNDYRLRTYNGENNQFDDYDNSATDAERYKIVAGGYVIQVLAHLAGKELTFVSVNTPVLTNSNAATLNSEYTLLANPAVTDINYVNGAGLHRYYDFGTGGETGFGLIPGDIARGLQAFEAIVVKKGDDPSFLTISEIDTQTKISLINEEDEANDPVIKTQYYTLQGIEVRQPFTDGIYIVKKVRTSQKIETVKQLFKSHCLTF